MNDQSERQRVTWTTRINVREAEQSAIRAIARVERISVATIIGFAIADYITARSTA